MMPLHSFTALMVPLFFFLLAVKVKSLPNFAPLTCNAALSVTKCWTDKIAFTSLISADSETNIPCGSCAVVDTTDGSTLSFPHGLNIEGMLYFPTTSNVTIETSHIFIQGILKIDPPIISNTVRVRMIGTQYEYLHPHAENSMECDSALGCNIGKKAIVVAGGTLDINGLSDPDCPAWTKLESIPDPNTLTIGSKAAECWGARAGGEIIVTNSEKRAGFNQNFVRTVDSSNVAAGTLTITNPINTAPTTIEIDPEMAAEVAWLTRRIIFEAELDGPSQLHGGHLIIYFTPGIAQRLEGVEIRSFGQQGNHGRYPIHFHMSGNVRGSVVRRNVIRSSKQRCVIIHGSNEVMVEDNVTYDTVGHCYGVEDGAETDNTFQGNLGVYNKRPSRGIGGTDSQASIFWITNTKNHFIGNVAVGIIGYWFELNREVGGLSATLPENKGIRPLYLPLYTFDNNTGHSCRTGIQTYGPGWFNRDDKVFEGLKSYRNNQGFFMHGTANLKIQNGFFADNGISLTSYGNQIKPNIIANSKFIGIPERYRGTKCASGMTGIHFGLESLKTQIHIHDTFFSGFGNMTAGCQTNGVALRQGGDSNHLRPPHVMPIVSNLTFDTNMVYAFDIKLASKLFDRNIFFEDPDGGMNPSGNPGFFINGIPSDHMTIFLENGACSVFPGSSYAQFCENICLRKLVVWGAHKMVVKSDNDPTKIIAIERNVFSNRYWHNNIELILPAGNFNVDFIDPESGQIVIPGDDDITYSFGTAPHCTSHISSESITFNYKIATGAPTGTPTGTSSFVRFQSRSDTNPCLVIDNDELIAANCTNIDEEYWLIDENGFLKNKTGKYVNKGLKLKNKPARFNENFVFVYNRFHETLISAKAFKAICSADGEIKLINYLKHGNVGSEHRWNVLA